MIQCPQNLFEVSIIGAPIAPTAEEKDKAAEVSIAAGVFEYQEHVQLENSDSARNEDNENGGIRVTFSGESWGESTIWSVAVRMF